MKSGVIVLSYYIHTRNLLCITKTIYQNHYKLCSELLLKLYWYFSFSGSLFRVRCLSLGKVHRPSSSKITDPNRQRSQTLIVKGHRHSSSKVTDPHRQRSQTLIVKGHRPHLQRPQTLIVKGHRPHLQRPQTLIVKCHRPSSSKTTDPYRQRSQTLIIKGHRPSSSKVTDPVFTYVVFVVSVASTKQRK